MRRFRVHDIPMIYPYVLSLLHPIAVSGGGTVPFNGGQSFAAGPPPGGAGGTAASILRAVVFGRWAMGWALGTRKILTWILHYHQLIRC